jgi:heme A synthase
MPRPDAPSRFARLTWWTIAVNLLVILWGAFVRASHSGAGCGNHWPLCNGEFIPPSPTVNTLIEFTHRLTSGLALLLVVALVVMAWRHFPRGHRVRAGAAITLAVMFSEALIGAGLVKFELVADNASLARALTLGAHLLNTLILLAALSAVALWAGGVDRPTWRGMGRRGGLLLLGTLGLVIVSTTGAIASLGDTLFPARTLGEGFAQDLDPTSHLLLRLRVLHPTLAVVVGTLVIWIALRCMAWSDSERIPAQRVIALVAVQWVVGMTSLLLLVPIPMQLGHLLVADLVWLAWIGLVVRVLAGHDAAADRSTAATARAASGSNTVPAASSR